LQPENHQNTISLRLQRMGRAFEYRKARKLKRWGTMAKTFTKLGKEIAIAVKSGGPDPVANSRLRVLIQNAKAANMPKDNVERAIKRAISKDQDDYKELVYEGYGPYGIAVLVETATDNPTRTVANVRSYFNKCNGSLGTSGSVEFMFEHKCNFKVKGKEGLDLEELELELIDFGVQEIFAEDEDILIYGDFESFGPIQKYLEENDFEIVSAEFERIPNDTKELNEEQVAEIEKLLGKLEEDDDVTNVFHNMKEPE
jgi:YebC/PmpR family DNA-binding regulatory protein